MERMTISQFILFLLVFILLYDVMFAIFSTIFVETYKLSSMVSGDGWLLATFVSFIETVLSWQVAVVVNTTSFAVLIALLFLMDLTDVEWRW